MNTAAKTKRNSIANNDCLLVDEQRVMSWLFDHDFVYRVADGGIITGSWNGQVIQFLFNNDKSVMQIRGLSNKFNFIDNETMISILDDYNATSIEPKVFGSDDYVVAECHVDSAYGLTNGQLDDFIFNSLFNIVKFFEDLEKSPLVQLSKMFEG